MWFFIPLMLALAIAMDILIHLKNPQRRNSAGELEPKIYYPNLRVWGIGFIAGLGIFAAQQFREATEKLNEVQLTEGVFWPRLGPIIYVVVVLWMLVWGIVRLCRSE